VIVEREISMEAVEKAVADPERVVLGHSGRSVYMRRYFDRGLQTDMLLRVVVEHADGEAVVVTAYRTSQIRKYFPEAHP